MFIGVIFSALAFTLQITIYHDTYWFRFSLRQAFLFFPAFLFPQNFLIFSSTWIILFIQKSIRNLIKMYSHYLP